MATLSETQIKIIREALKKSGVVYVDILHEMTDHTASALEKMDGDFETNLTAYITRNKKMLRRYNRKNILIAWKKSVMGLLQNMITVRFALLTGGLYLIINALAALLNAETFTGLMFFAFIGTNASLSFPGIYAIVKKRDQYSAGEGLALLNAFVFFPGLYGVKYIKNAESPFIPVLYFTLLIAVCIVMSKTYIGFKKKYKLRYNG